MLDLFESPARGRAYEHATRRGKHKIFIGMASGVGKTYRMLDEAHRLKQTGVDVVIGLLETHDRQETLDKAIGLEVLPRKTMIRGGLIFSELDPDAVLARQPRLVLIDELAYPNLPGAKRDQRYQDIEAILAAGIDIYSTVNIQHLEHLSDRVTQITGIRTQGCLPECLLDKADSVVVVDVTPETLETRLLTGKICPPEKIDQALHGFFQRRNLVALRELALREVADQIEEEGLRQAVQRCSNDHTQQDETCCIHERVLVCISTHPNSLRLIRRGAKIAGYMNAPLYVLLVSDPDRFLTKTESRYVETCERRCQKVDGKFLQIAGENPAEEIVKAARSYRVTQVVVGQSHQSRWQDFLGGSLVSRLTRSLKQIDVHIVSTSR
ncbi:MAG: universal stress protein [Phormidesmis sp. CAN_BIN44]|nr:universal stress protein [Phormidesmis sp. CAN_BIN44]